MLPKSYLITFFFSHTVLLAYRSVQFIKLTVLFPISLSSHKQLLFLEHVIPCSSQGWILLLFQVLILTSSYHMTRPQSRCCQYSAHLTLRLPFIFTNMNSQCAFTPNCWHLCLFVRGWISGFPNGFDCTWRAGSAYWFIFLSTLEHSFNQCLMGEEYKCSICDGSNSEGELQLPYSSPAELSQSCPLRVFAWYCMPSFYGPIPISQPHFPGSTFSYITLTQNLTWGSASGKASKTTPTFIQLFSINAPHFLSSMRQKLFL